MKQLFIILSFALLFLYANSGLCQSSIDNWDRLSLKSNSLKGKLVGTRFYPRPIYRGTYFYHSKWVKGIVTFENGETFENLDLKLNSFLDDLIYYNARNGATIIIDKDRLKSFQIIGTNGNIEDFEKIHDGSWHKDRYYRKIYTGAKSLYVWYRTFEQKTEPYMDSKDVLQNTELALSKEYYIFSHEAKFQRIRANRKSFIEYLPESKREIKRAFRRNRIFKMNDEKDMIKAFRVLDKEGLLNK